METKRVGNVNIIMDEYQNRSEASFGGLVGETLSEAEYNNLLIGNSNLSRKATIFKENPFALIVGKIDDTYSCISGISMKKVSATAIVDVFLQKTRFIFVDMESGIMSLLGKNRCSPDFSFHNRPCTMFKVLGSTALIFKTSFLESIRDNTNREDGKVSSTVIASLMGLEANEGWKVIQHDGRDILIRRADYAKAISDSVGIEFGGTDIYADMRTCFPGTVSYRTITRPLDSIKMRGEVKGNLDTITISFVDYMERILAPTYKLPPHKRGEQR